MGFMVFCMAKALTHKLREKDIVDILYSFYVDRESITSIAKNYGVSFHTVVHHIERYRKDFYRISDYCSSKYGVDTEEYGKCVWKELKVCVRNKMWKKLKKKQKKQKEKKEQ